MRRPKIVTTVALRVGFALSLLSAPLTQRTTLIALLILSVAGSLDARAAGCESGIKQDCANLYSDDSHFLEMEIVALIKRVESSQEERGKSNSPFAIPRLVAPPAVAL